MKYTRRIPETIYAYTFKEVLDCGRIQGANIVNGMPWSFMMCGCPVTHETDNHYIITVGARQYNLGPDDMLVVINDTVLTQTKEWFDHIYTPSHDETTRTERNI